MNLQESKIKDKAKSYEIENDLNSESTISNGSNEIMPIFGIFLIIFVLILTILFCTISIVASKNTKILNGISIMGIDVSNLSKNEAKQKIEKYISSSIPDEIILRHNDFETSISTSQLSIYFNTDEAVNLAYNIGKEGNILKKDAKMIEYLFKKTNINPGFSMDKKQLKYNLEDISTKLPDKMVESGYYIDGNNLIITKGSSGNAVDINKSASLIIKNVNNLNIKDNYIELCTYEQNPKEINIENIYNEIHKEPVNASYTQNPFNVIPSENGLDFAISIDKAKELLQKSDGDCTIPLKVLYPSITTNMIGTEAFPDLLSQFSTKYSVRNRNRTTNLMLAANKINGTVLMPGEVFSYNKIVGERTISAGYKEAPIYVNGKVEDGLGGGICQIATTLYNAVLYANLEVVERRNHQFVPSYVGASRDATVVYGAIDFKFKNNRQYPIKIVCSVSGGIANFKIFGLKSDDDYEVLLNAYITGNQKNAIYSQCVKTLKKDGNIISSQVISKDMYKRH